MIGRTVEIAGEGRHLRLSRGFMVVEDADGEVGRVPIDDLGCVIGSARGLTCSSNLMVALAERGATLVLLAPNFMPVAWLWPLQGHHVQGARMAAQLDAGVPLRKRLWQAVVRAKIMQQAAALESLGLDHGGFDMLARRVRSGDPENVEAQAARR
ncbi:MAG: CRISPR-associated endonuclease Cas1, partial [Alphaproteobacteria bacterium]